MKTSTHKFITGLALAATLAFSISSCKKDDDDNSNGLTASLSFVNTVEGSVAQDLYINDSKVSTSALAYGSFSGNMTTTPSSKVVTFKNNGSATTTASANINLDVNASATAYLVKQGDGTMAVTTYFNDNTSVSGKAKVRFINVAPTLTSTLNVVTSTGTNLASALAFKAASAYQTVDANTNLAVSMTGSLDITTISGAELQAGKVYTIWFDNQTSTKVKYHVIVQN